jgi:hypothetical protein
MNPTPMEELRKPHPEQKRIDSESAALLRATAIDPRLHKPPVPAQASLQNPFQIPSVRRPN